MVQMSVRVGMTLCVLGLSMVAACGGDDDDQVQLDAAVMLDAAVPDAEVPDALDPCALCTATQDCVANVCECPDGPVIPDPFNPILSQMDTVMEAPDVLGIAAFSPDGARVDALVVGFHPTDTPVDTNIDLSTVAPGVAPFVGYGYDVDVVGMTTRGTLRSTSGVLHLTQRCAEGVSGSMTDVVLVEVDPTTEPATVLTDGCSFSIAAVDFDFGSACP